MSSPSDKEESRSVAGVIIFAVLLAIGTALGIGVYQSRKGAAETAEAATPAGVPPVVTAAPTADAAAPASSPVDSASASAPANAAPAAAPVEPVAASPAPAEAKGSVVVENGVVKFYFASGKSELPAGAVPALQTAIDAAKAGKRLVLSGFHDATGSPARNSSLANGRAQAVRAALLAAGVAEGSIEIKQPEQTVGSGNPAEARRVEVAITG
jgi:outer membrane protein OmpA-like peptidoglycan-associated protein